MEKLVVRRGNGQFMGTSGEKVNEFFCVHESLNESVGYSVTHIKSGCCVPMPFATKENAVFVANMLNDSLIDWNKSKAELTKADMKNAAFICKKYGIFA